MQTNHNRCRYCNQRIEWIDYENPLTGAHGWIPLDPKAITYQFDGNKWGRSSAMVAHPATCKNRPEPEPGGTGPKQWWQDESR